MRRYGLRDDQWERIERLLPGRDGSVGVTAADNHLFAEAALHRYRAGIPWRDLPERFGDWKNVHRRFSRWARSGVWQRIFQHLAADADNEYAMIDSIIVRAHQHSAGAPQKPARIRRSGGGLSTKIHTLVEALGNPIGCHLTGGEAYDLLGADHLPAGMRADMLIADKAFDADARVIRPLEAAGKMTVIPPKANRRSPRAFDRHLCKAGHPIENFFAKLKQFRAIATSYDKTARNFLAAIHLAASAI